MRGSIHSQELDQGWVLDPTSQAYVENENIVLDEVGSQVKESWE